MQSKTLLGLCALLWLVAPAIKGQTRATAQTGARLSGGAYVAIKTDYVALRPGAVLPERPKQVETHARAEANTIQRVLVDEAAGLYFGYEVEIEALTEAKQFRVTVKPLSPAFVQRWRERRASALRELPLPRFPPPQTLDDGDTLALDVLVNAQAGSKLVDFITVSLNQPPASEAPAPGGPARDFRVEDVPLKVRDFQVLINGEVAAQSKGGCAGQFIYFYLPGRGRFVFALAPPAGYGFQKSAVIEQNKIAFTLGGDSYEWISSVPILEGGGHWHLWVWHDPAYRPGLQAGRNAYGFGAADRFEALTRQRE